MYLIMIDGKLAFVNPNIRKKSHIIQLLKVICLLGDEHISIFMTDRSIPGLHFTLAGFDYQQTTAYQAHDLIH